jgi:hypothetical protein
LRRAAGGRPAFVHHDETFVPQEMVAELGPIEAVERAASRGLIRLVESTPLDLSRVLRGEGIPRCVCRAG